MSKAKDRVRRTDVTAAMDREGARLVDLVERDPDRVVLAGWSARDVLAHCIYWQGMLARMMGAPLPPPSWIPRWQSEDQIGDTELNRLTVEHFRLVAFERVLEDFRFTADLVKRIVGEMKEENLLLEAGAPWDAGTPVWKAIAGETHGHWKEHADQLETA